MIERKTEQLIYELVHTKEYVEFLVGKNGAFDQLISSCVRRVKAGYRADNSELVWVLPYQTAEYRKNTASFENYYDAIELCEASAKAHPKAAIQIRNQCMVDRSDLVVFCIDHSYGGAYQTYLYAKKKEKKILNLTELLK